MFSKIIVFIVLNYTCYVQSAKILGVYPFPSISHQVIFRKITEELLKRGHEITIITTDPAYPSGKTPVNLTEIDVNNKTYATKEDFLINSPIVGNDDIHFKIRISKKLMAYVFEALLNVIEVQDLIKSQKKFDVILIESMVRPAYVFSHIFQAPLILVSSLGVMFSNNNVMGMSSHPLLYPSTFDEKIYSLTFWEKTKSFYNYFMTEYEDMEFQEAENKMLQKYFGPDVPPVSDLCNNVDMLLLNVHPIWADNQPVPPNVIYFGGMNLKEKKDLPKDLLTYLDSSIHGVIYVSFGTNALASFIPKKIVESIVRVLSRMPYDVLWKWDQDNLPLNPKNIKISKWFPQSDLLKHKKIKLFITQAGLQSTDEAIHAGVPLLAIPMLGDQSFNADKYVRHGIGKKILMANFEEETFKKSMENILNDESYRQNVSKLRKLMLDQPEPPQDRAIWWIEYVIRNQGAKHLRAPAANMSWMRYIEIEVILIACAAVVMTITAVVVALLFLYKFLVANIFVNSNTKLKKM